MLSAQSLSLMDLYLIEDGQGNVILKNGILRENYKRGKGGSTRFYISHFSLLIEIKLSRVKDKIRIS